MSGIIYLGKGVWINTFAADIYLTGNAASIAYNVRHNPHTKLGYKIIKKDLGKLDKKLEEEFYSWEDPCIMWLLDDSDIKYHNCQIILGDNWDKSKKQYFEEIHNKNLQ